MPNFEPSVIIRTENRLGYITLNRPKAINALSHEMVKLVHKALRVWRDDPDVRAVVIDGAGERGLCAGGDIRAIYDDMLAGTCHSLDYWADEYRMNIEIAEYPKPILVFMDGFVMGGGVGISGHASHRIVNETSAVAMPEVLIGFVPDVGGTYLLGHAPGELGTHLALTNERMDGADAIACGFADAWVPRESRADLLSRLHHGQDVNEAVRALAISPPASKLAENRKWIDECYSAPTVEEIFTRLAKSPRSEARDALAKLADLPPTSMKVTLRALREARPSNLAECLQREYRIAVRVHAGHDFAEGIRARIIDRSSKATWKPSEVEDVSDQNVEAYFKPLGPAELDLYLGYAPSPTEPIEKSPPALPAAAR